MIEFKEQLEAIVGQSRVFVDADWLSTYGQDRSLAKPMRPKAVVKVLDTTEVERISNLLHQCDAYPIRIGDLT